MSSSEAPCVPMKNPQASIEKLARCSAARAPRRFTDEMLFALVGQNFARPGFHSTQVRKGAANLTRFLSYLRY
jgi:hypothetical protein